jgi:hypothetical protein
LTIIHGTNYHPLQVESIPGKQTRRAAYSGAALSGLRPKKTRRQAGGFESAERLVLDAEIVVAGLARLAYVPECCLHRVLVA